MTASHDTERHQHEQEPCESCELLYDEEVLKLWAEHAQGVLAFLIYLGADPELANELRQDAFLIARRRWGKWRSREPEGLLFGTARNLLRWHKFREAQKRPLSEVAPERALGDPDEAILRADLRSALWELPRRQRQVVALRYLHDYDVATTAELLGVSRNAVKRYAHDGLANLKELLRGYEDGREVAQ